MTNLPGRPNVTSTRKGSADRRITTIQAIVLCENKNRESTMNYDHTYDSTEMYQYNQSNPKVAPSLLRGGLPDALRASTSVAIYDAIAKVVEPTSEWNMAYNTNVISSTLTTLPTVQSRLTLMGHTLWARPSGNSDIQVHTALHALKFNQVHEVPFYPPLVAEYFRSRAQAFLSTHSPVGASNGSIDTQLRNVMVAGPVGLACSHADTNVFENTRGVIENIIAVRQWYAKGDAGAYVTRPTSFLPMATGRTASKSSGSAE